MKQITFRIQDEDYEFINELSDSEPRDYIRKHVISFIENKRNPIPDSKELLRRILELYPILRKRNRQFAYITFQVLYDAYFEKYGSTKKYFKIALETLLDDHNLITNSKTTAWIISLSKGMYVAGNDIRTKYDHWKYIELHPEHYEGKLSWGKT